MQINLFDLTNKRWFFRGKKENAYPFDKKILHFTSHLKNFSFPAVHSNGMMTGTASAIAESMIFKRNSAEKQYCDCCGAKLKYKEVNLCTECDIKLTNHILQIATKKRLFRKKNR